MFSSGRTDVMGFGWSVERKKIRSESTLSFLSLVGEYVCALVWARVIGDWRCFCLLRCFFLSVSLSFFLLFSSASEERKRKRKTEREGKAVNTDLTHLVRRVNHYFPPVSKRANSFNTYDT